MSDEAARVEVKERYVLRKFEGEVPPDCADPVAAGYKLLEEIEIHEDGTVERRTP